MASRFTKRQLETRDFILQLYRKELPITRSVIKKFVSIFVYDENAEITEKYGDRLVVNLIYMYKPKNIEDFKFIFNAFKTNPHYKKHNGLTIYGIYPEQIVRSFFKNEKIKTEWIMQELFKGSVVSVKTFTNYVASKVDGAEQEKLMKESFELIKNSDKRNDIAIQFINSFTFMKKLSYFSIMSAYLDLIERNENSIRQIRYNIDNAYITEHKSYSKNDFIPYAAAWMYAVTEDVKYIPKNAKDIFIF